MNAHLQVEYLQMSPPSNGNFLPPSCEAEAPGKLSIQTGGDGQPITTISIMDSPKFRQKSPTAAEGPKTKVEEEAASVAHLPAMGPALLESFR
jgi:hypothetical protein